MKPTRENEIRALLASSGEAQLNDTERQQTAKWRRDLETLTAAAQSACNRNLPSKLSTKELAPKTRVLITSQRVRFQRFRLIKHLATAASLILVAGGAFLHYTHHQEQANLERLGTVLFLLENAEEAEAYGWDTDDTVTLESLAEQLREMQYANN